MNSIKSISVVIPVTERGDNFLQVFEDYHSSISKIDLVVEYIIILTPTYSYLAEPLKDNFPDSKDIKIILLNRDYGEAGVLKIGVEHSEYAHILTLTPYEQILPSEIGTVIDALADNDAVVVNRWPRIDPLANRIQSFIFRGILKTLSYNAPKDSGCGIRVAKKEVFVEIRLYGDLHRFFLILARQAGYDVLEIDVPQSKSDSHKRMYSLRTYLSRTLDIFTVAFLIRFNQKPLRFFGTFGAISFFIGSAGLGYIAIERLFFNVAAADRPLLVLFSLFLVLGVQLIAIGLVGETIIFTSSKNNKGYRIRKIIN